MRGWAVGLCVLAMSVCTTNAAAREKRLHHGVPVLGGKYAQAKAFDHLDTLSSNPSVARERAETTALAAVADTSFHDSRLVVLKPRRASEAILAWQVTVRGRQQDWRVDVDAQTGLVVQKTALRMHERGSGKGVFGDSRVVNYERDHGDDVMIDSTRDSVIFTLDARNGTSLDRADPVTSIDGRSWDTNSAAPGAAVDAAYHVGVTADFYKDVLGRDGWGKHSGDIVLAVHWDRAFENAQYSQVDDALVFGDGGSKQQPLAAFLDIVAHEYTHAITARTSELDYAGQPGALNEAISDIFGALVEHSVHPDAHDNWLHGEGSLKGVSNIDGADRDFANPHDSNPPQPAHMNEFVDAGDEDDAGGVHSNSGIINQAAYLMTAGGTNPVSNITVKNPIGWKKLAQVWYRVNTDYLGPNSDFADAAGATLDAARELDFSDVEIETIECAWQAVGVLDGSCKQKEVTLADPDGDDDDDDDDGANSSPSSTGKSKANGGLVPAAALPSCAATPRPTSSHGGLVACGVALALLRLRGARTRNRRGAP